jgi:5-methylcytosine-specific restriction endonuclease McrA
MAEPALTELHASFGEHTINQLVLMFRDQQINLDPGFQRRSVWTTVDRRRLIQSIVSGYPLPSIFFYRRSVNGKLVYDVIDGKQRLETLFMFMGLGRFARNRFDAKLDLGDGLQVYQWRDIEKRFPEHRAVFESYKIQTVEVTGGLAQIIDLFIRINSTGKRLTTGEKRNARFYTSKFLKEADRLMHRFQYYMLDAGVLSAMQLDRMKGTELTAELLMSIHNGGPINRKTALDRSIGNENINGNTLSRLSREFVRTMNLLKKMFPALSETRFTNIVEFYTLFLFVWEMDRERLVLTDKPKNAAAFELLRKLSTGVDDLRQQLRRAVPARATQRLYSDYLLTVQGQTDSGSQRERRQDLLKSVLWSLFDTKDDQRLFTVEQRRIIWNSDEKRVCNLCGDPLTWNDVTIDHIIAYTKGGKTTLKNAQLAHRHCNSRKGSR